MNKAASSEPCLVCGLDRKIVNTKTMLVWIYYGCEAGKACTMVRALCASLNSTVVCSTSDSEGGAVATEKAMVTQHVVVYMMHDGTGLVKCRSCHIDAL